MNMMESINSFVETMLEEQHQFEQLQSEVSRCEKETQEIISGLGEQEKKLIAQTEAAMQGKQSEEIRRIFQESSHSLEQELQNASKAIEAEIKGMNFIETFEKRFTIAVFGKVKAGKSYIGNFIMGHPMRKYGVKSAYDKLEPPVVQVYDRGKQTTQTELSEQSDDPFSTGMKETTSTIQWFDIGGLSWFDTPGIGSVTWENEMLAKEYVQNADLVVFACNSDAAGTRQEFAEMRQLYDMGKPILLLLTQSDTYEYDIDEDDNEISVLVPKSDKDRTDTEQYMVQTLEEQGMSDMIRKYEILTVSAKLAVEALKTQDEELFRQSNMGLLLEKLVAITKNDAAKIKKKTPRDRLRKMIDGVIKNMNHMAEKIDETCQSVDKSREDLQDQRDTIVERINHRVYEEINRILQEYKVEIENNGGIIKEETISARIQEAVRGCICEVCAEKTLEAGQKIQDLEFNLTGFGDMKMEKDQIPYEHVSITRVRRDAEGWLEKAGEFFLHKEYYTSKKETEIRFNVFDIGVNTAELAQNITLQLETDMREAVFCFVDNLVNDYYAPITKLQKESIRLIYGVTDRLEALKEKC